MWMPRSNPSPCARTTRMSPTRGLWGSRDARASYSGYVSARARASTYRMNEVLAST